MLRQGARHRQQIVRRRPPCESDSKAPATADGTNGFQLGLPADVRKEPATSVDFVEEARFTKDDFG